MAMSEFLTGSSELAVPAHMQCKSGTKRSRMIDTTSDGFKLQCIAIATFSNSLVKRWIPRYHGISSGPTTTVVECVPLCGRTQLLQAAVMLQRNGLCRFQLNVTTCVDDWSCFHVMHLTRTHYSHCPLYIHIHICTVDKYITVVTFCDRQFTYSNDNI